MAYKVEAWWLDNLMKGGKLDPEVYLQYAARVGVGFKRRLEDIRAAQRYEKEQTMIAHVAAEDAALRGTILPAKSFPEVEKFVDYFRSRQHRRPILAIIGGTNLGKSLLAADVMRKVGAILGVHDFLGIAVETDEHLDLTDSDVRYHAGVILDGVGDAMIVKKNRVNAQGRPKLAKGAQSATTVYAYKNAVCQRAAVATFDLSSENLQGLRSDHWLRDPKNVIQLWLKEKAYDETAAPLAAVAPATRRAAKRVRV